MHVSTLFTISLSTKALAHSYITVTKGNPVVNMLAWSGVNYYLALDNRSWRFLLLEKKKIINNRRRAIITKKILITQNSNY